MRKLLAHPLVVPLAIAGLAVAARLIPAPRTIDDAFITFRYARNLLAGQGFVYNPGERVLGTTTPLYTLLLAALAGMLHTGNYPWLALGANALADGVTCLLLVPLGERLSGRRAVGVSAALLWAVAPMSVTFAIGGMETSMFIGLMMATFALYLWERTNLAAFTAALALLTRPDALLFVGPLMLDFLVRGWKAKRPASLPRAPCPVSVTFASPALCFLLPLLPWTLFATIYFGSPFAHSVAAKSVAYYLPPASALVRLLQHYSTPFFEQLLFPSFPVLIALLIAYLSLAAIAGLHFVRRDSRAWPLATYPLIYLIVFSAFNPLIFRWYLAPPLPVYFLLILGGIGTVISDQSSVISHHAKRSVVSRRSSVGGRRSAVVLRPSSFILPSSAFLLLSLNAWTLHPDHGPGRPAPQMAWHQLELIYERVGRELAPLAAPDRVIAAGDVGALGYFSGARILDALGLMSPQAVKYYPLPASAYVINYAVAPDLVLDEKPDFVVILEVYGRETLITDPRFAAEYTLFQKIPTDIYGSDGLLVFRRNP